MTSAAELLQNKMAALQSELKKSEHMVCIVLTCDYQSALTNGYVARKKALLVSQ